MKTVRDLPLWPLWVNPEHRVKSALVMMRGHRVSSLGVIKGDTFLGMVHVEDLVGVGEDEPVELVMRRGTETVSPEMSLRRLADYMAERSLAAVSVLHDEEFKGIVTAQDLLKHIGRNIDPLTHLPWSDLLREWAAARLQEGREVTILFFDLNDFGRFNKEFGHTVGDKVLQTVADVMRRGVDPALDVLCRYGGDEFAVATIRPREEAEMLANWLYRKITSARVPGSPLPAVEAGGSPVSSVGVSVGIFGGRRTQERENVHFAATVDNLINLASKQCIAAKSTSEPAEEEPESSGGEPVIENQASKIGLPDIMSVRVTEAEQGIRVISVLRDGRDLLTGVEVSSEGVARTAAAATVSALRDAAHGALELADVSVTLLGENRRMVTVSLRLDGRESAGSQVIETIEAEAAAAAVLKAYAGLA